MQSRPFDVHVAQPTIGQTPKSALLGAESVAEARAHVAASSSNTEMPMSKLTRMRHSEDAG